MMTTMSLMASRSDALSRSRSRMISCPSRSNRSPPHWPDSGPDIGPAVVAASVSTSAVAIPLAAVRASWICRRGPSPATAVGELAFVRAESEDLQEGRRASSAARGPAPARRGRAQTEPRVTLLLLASVVPLTRDRL